MPPVASTSSCAARCAARAPSTRAAPASSAPAPRALTADSNPGAVTRRHALGSALALVTGLGAASLGAPAPAHALDTSRYIKRKKLDPLETYVAPVVLAREQLAESVATVSSADVQGARDLLRGGAFSGLRDNVRALGEYAASEKKENSSLVPSYFTALEKYDYNLFITIKESRELDKDAAVTLGNAALAAMDALIATVPTDALDKATTVVEKVKQASAEVESQSDSQVDDATLKRLQQLV